MRKICLWKYKGYLLEYLMESVTKGFACLVKATIWFIINWSVTNVFQSILAYFIPNVVFRRMVAILFITVNKANLRDLVAATGLGILLKQKEVFLELLGRN